MNLCLVGDNLDALPALDADRFEACVTDPPYGIGFMGREWDTFNPQICAARNATRRRKDLSVFETNPNLKGRTKSPAKSNSQMDYDESSGGHKRFQAWTETWAREVYRVLKPGAHLLVCGAPRSYHRMTCGIEDAGFEIRDCIMWVFGQGFPKSRNLKDEWQGWGTALKPSWEPILVARKPMPSSVAANVLEFGTGAINIAGCRIPVEDEDYVRNCSGDRGHDGTRSMAERGATDMRMGGGCAAAGRWPANLIHDGSDEVVALFPAEAGAARFYYCAKTSRHDRNEGCEDLERKPLNWSSGDQSPGTFQSEGTDKTSPNNHPTVKPTSLMRYLVRLVTPPGGTVLDPFGGSGSTGKACIYEGFNCVSIEKESDYADISRARWAFAERDHAERCAQQEMALA